MNALLARLRAVSAEAWLRFVQILNGLALSAGGVVIAINAMYPNAVNDAVGTLPPFAKLAALAAWAGMVHYALASAKKPS